MAVLHRVGSFFLKDGGNVICVIYFKRLFNFQPISVVLTVFSNFFRSYDYTQNVISLGRAVSRGTPCFVAS